MRAQGIEPGREYVAGTNGTHRYAQLAKCRVIGPGKAVDRPGGSRAHKSGHKLWEVEWLRMLDSNGPPTRVDKRSTIPSAWFVRDWTAEDEGLADTLSERETAHEALFRRLLEAFGLERSDRYMIDGRPEAHMRGQMTEAPTFTLTKSAVEKLLIDYQHALEE